MALNPFKRNREERGLPTNVDPYQLTARPLFGNFSGEVVNEKNSFASSAFISCITLLADSIAAMPLEMFIHEGDTLKRVANPPVLDNPNSEQLMFDFVHQAIATLCVHGVDFIYAPMGNDGYPLELRNLHPNTVVAIPTDDGSSYYYEIDNKRYERDLIKQMDWLRMPGQVRGISPLEALRQTIGTDLAINRHLAAFYGDGATPSSVLETDSQLTIDQAEVLRQTWTDMHYKSRKPAVLAGGLKWRPISTSASDMDTMQHREAIVRDIARVFRIPLNLIHASGGQTLTYTNVESAGINFVRHTLLPHMRRLEGIISNMLPPNYKVQFNADEYLRGDLHARVQAAQIQIASGMLTPNEARHIEDREPYVGGDNFVLNLPGTAMAGGELPPLGKDSYTGPQI